MGSARAAGKRSLSTDIAVDCRCFTRPSWFCPSKLMLSCQWSLSLCSPSLSLMLSTTCDSCPRARGAACSFKAEHSCHKWFLRSLTRMGSAI